MFPTRCIIENDLILTFASQMKWCSRLRLGTDIYHYFKNLFRPSLMSLNKPKSKTITPNLADISQRRSTRSKVIQDEDALQQSPTPKATSRPRASINKSTTVNKNNNEQSRSMIVKTLKTTQSSTDKKSVTSSIYFTTEPPANKGNKKRSHVKVVCEEAKSTTKTTSPYFEDKSLDKKTSNNSKKDKWVPENWNEVVSNIREMRKSSVAPVDEMGCDIWNEGDSHPPEVKRYHSLISLMLSSQTRDQVNYAAMVKLQGHGLTIDNILKTTDEKLGELIHPVSYWKTKVKHIKKATEILKEEYNGDIPDTVEKLCSLPGVGPKMAHICMNVAWGQNTGIGVDTHVHRISNRLGWVRKTTKKPEDTRVELESWLPRDLWQEVNHMLVGFGQTVCRSVHPKCASCLNRKICPVGRKAATQK